MPPLDTKFNVFAECRESRLTLWECPPFLFVVMGMVNVITAVTVYVFAVKLVDEPQLAALIVVGVSALIFLIGNFLITGFNKIAEANRLKSEFLNLVSHQLRTPLSVFKWTLELVQSRDHSDAKTVNYLNILGEHTERMVRLVNLLLDVSRIEAGRFTLQRVPVPLEKLTAEAIQSLRPYAESSRVVITYEDKSKGEVRGDVERLRMVIQNLIDNAIRYSSEAGRVDVITTNIKNDIEWRISDRGLGIPKGQQKYIFQKFFRATNGTHQQTQGTGLGLYIARQIVKELGGTIGFESEEGKGSTFWFRLPTNIK